MLDRMNKYSAQSESDAVAVIAETIETLLSLLQEFDEKASWHGQKQLELAWPSVSWPDHMTVARLTKLSNQLAPPDEYDPADRNLRD